MKKNSSNNKAVNISKGKAEKGKKAADRQTTKLEPKIRDNEEEERNAEQGPPRAMEKTMLNRLPRRTKSTIIFLNTAQMFDVLTDANSRMNRMQPLIIKLLIKFKPVDILQQILFLRNGMNFRKWNQVLFHVVYTRMSIVTRLATCTNAHKVENNTVDGWLEHPPNNPISVCAPQVINLFQNGT